jgi:catechol 2,3-dioxygenase-like lactoylglutathione lyase family enzyme
MSINITALDHVQITVPPELEAEAKRFYGKVPGLTEIEKPAKLKARGGEWHALGTVQLHLAVDPGASGIASRRHVCLRVDDLAAARAALAEQGLAIIDEPITADGLTRFFVRDPAGNRIEIGERH